MPPKLLMSPKASQVTYAQALELTIQRIRHTLWLHGYESDPELVVKLSLKDVKYFDHIRLTIGALILEQKPLPAPYRYWLNAYLTDGLTVPKRKQGRRENPYDIERVVDLVSELVQMGLKPTRNDETTTHESACDVVAIALKECGKNPQSYARVKRVWLDNRGKTFD